MEGNNWEIYPATTKWTPKSYMSRKIEKKNNNYGAIFVIQSTNYNFPADPSNSPPTYEYELWWKEAEKSYPVFGKWTQNDDEQENW